MRRSIALSPRVAAGRGARGPRRRAGAGARSLRRAVPLRPAGGLGARRPGPAELQAGAHPYAMTTTFRVADAEAGGVPLPDEALKDSRFAQIPGFVGYPPTAAERCPLADFLTTVSVTAAKSRRPARLRGIDRGRRRRSRRRAPPALGTQVTPPSTTSPPPPGVGRASWASASPRCRSRSKSASANRPPTGSSRATDNTSQVLEVDGFELTLWGVPADSAHDTLRGHCLSRRRPRPARAARADGPERPFLTLPRACRGPLATACAANSWQRPGRLRRRHGAHPRRGRRPAGLRRLRQARLRAPNRRRARPPAPPSAPRASTSPSTSQDEGLASPDGTRRLRHRKDRRHPARGDDASTPPRPKGSRSAPRPSWRARRACSAPGEGCPQASKIGTIEVETPLLRRQLLKGSLYRRRALRATRPAR